MSESVGASTSRNPKGLHGLYRDNFTEMPRTDVTLADRIALLEKIKNQLPNTSHHQLAEIAGMPKSTFAHVMQQQEKL
jgi:hypothetical protein